MLKQIIKRSAQVLLAGAGPHRWPVPAPRLLVLMYHRVLPRDDVRATIEQPGMIVTPETFALHLALLKRYFAMVKLGDWLRASAAGAPVPAQACAITFDDGWRDNLEFGFPALQRAAVPATVFLVSDLVGTSRPFWPQRLAMALCAAARDCAIWQAAEFRWLRALGAGYRFDAVPPSSAELDDIVCRAKGFTEDELHARLDAMEPLLDAFPALPPPLLDWDQARAMHASGLVEFGSHTRRHVRMTPALSRDRLHDEIAGSKALIAHHLGCEVDLFCYPNGDMTPAAEQIVQAHYAGACTTRKGWHGRGKHPYRIRRIGVHEDVSRDATAFLARLSGWI